MATLASAPSPLMADRNLRDHHLNYQDWTLQETTFDPNQLHHKETVFTIGNGYLETRGSFEEGYSGSQPVTMMHGVYDLVPIFYTEHANCPNWLSLDLMIDGQYFSLEQGEILSYERTLDLKTALLRRKVRWCSPTGKTLDIEFERFASLADQHVLGIHCRITPVDFSGEIKIQAGLNGYTENQGYNHWQILDQGTEEADQSVWLQVRTRNSDIELGTATKLTLEGASEKISTHNVPGFPTVEISFQGSPGQTVTLEKMVTVFTSRDVKDPIKAAQEKLTQLSSYATESEKHQQEWHSVWQQSDVVIEGDTFAQLAIRYNLFQLLASAPRHDDQVSIPAKTLSGFGYRGHVFWDTEIFILPFFTFTQPPIARNLLSYRYHTLEGARRKAFHYGCKGAMFAWESADTGDEVTPRRAIPLDPYAQDVRIWCRDLEVHISADIAYGIWHYWQVTQDDSWMRDYGAEIILDGATFWSSRVVLNIEAERYEIQGVIGADENHEQDVNNNALTNRLAQWHLEKALFLYDWLKENHPEKAAELEEQLELTAKRRSRWQDIIDNIWIPYNAETGMIEQFEGFFDLKDIDLEDYEPRTRSMQDILGIEGANHWQALKQPDVLMLLYLMRRSQEFPYSKDVLEKNWNYYAPRTDITYGSSLGPSIHAILAADLGDAQEAYERFMQAALVDIEDVRGNAKEGVHAASAGGLWQAAVFGFGGIQLTEQGPVANPHLPQGWKRLQFKLYWQGEWHEFDLRPTTPTTTPPIQGVIFDLDGVLTDTAEYHYQGWQKLADELKIPFNREGNEALRGLSRRESILALLGENHGFSEAELQEMMTRKNDYYLELIKNISAADLLPGALDFVKQLKAEGIKVAIGSGSKNAKGVIERLQIGDYIDAISDGHSVANSKPAPDLFFHAAKQLGIAPEACIVVEDASSGVAAARSAGMWTIGLGPSDRVGAADIVLENLDGVTWTDLKPTFEG